MRQQVVLVFHVCIAKITCSGLVMGGLESTCKPLKIVRPLKHQTASICFRYKPMPFSGQTDAEKPKPYFTGGTSCPVKAKPAQNL